MHNMEAYFQVLGPLTCSTQIVCTNIYMYTPWCVILQILHFPTPVAITNFYLSCLYMSPNYCT